MSNFLKDIFSGKKSLNINGKSKHLNTDIEFNENNLGIGLTSETPTSLATLGYYKNSLGKDSVYAGAGVKKRFGKDLYLDLGIVGGGVTGYDKAITPMALPMVSIGLKDMWKINLLMAPKYKDNPTTLMMNLGIPF